MSVVGLVSGEVVPECCAHRKNAMSVSDGRIQRSSTVELDSCLDAQDVVPEMMCLSGEFTPPMVQRWTKKKLKLWSGWYPGVVLLETLCSSATFVNQNESEGVVGLVSGWFPGRWT